MSFFETVDKVFHDWNYNHPRILYAFARALRPSVIVDCGTYRGLSASWMARACQENNFGKVHCIDNFSLKEHVDRYGDPRAHLESNLEACGVKEWVEIHEGESSDPAMWPDKVDFCYIDGWHSYKQCRKDFTMALERGATFIALDDTENCVGPRILAEDMFNDGILPEDEWQQLDIHSDNGLAIFSKKHNRRPVTFSQELPLPCIGVDLRPMTLDQQKAHFDEASKITRLEYSSILQSTEHDTIL